MIENKTILVVDDDPKIATLLQTYLEGCGFGVHTVSNGRACLEFLDGDNSIDAVVLDVMMPELDGFATVQERRTYSGFAYRYAYRSRRGGGQYKA